MALLSDERVRRDRIRVSGHHDQWRWGMAYLLTDKGGGRLEAPKWERACVPPLVGSMAARRCGAHDDSLTSPDDFTHGLALPTSLTTSLTTSLGPL